MRRVVHFTILAFVITTVSAAAEARSPWADDAEIQCRYVRMGWTVRRVCKSKKRSRRWARANRRWRRTPYRYGVMVVPRATEPAPAPMADEFPSAVVDIPQPDLDIPHPDLNSPYGETTDDWQRGVRRRKKMIEPMQRVERAPESDPDPEPRIEVEVAPVAPPKPVPEAKPEPEAKPAPQPVVPRAVTPESKVTMLLNAKRLELGLKPVTLEPLASQVALAHSKDMCARRFFDHQNPNGQQPWDRMREAGMRFVGAAENIAVGYSTAEAVHIGWLTSPDHRKNRLNPSYTRIGVGAYKCGPVLYWTEVFAK